MFLIILDPFAFIYVCSGADWGPGTLFGTERPTKSGPQHTINDLHTSLHYNLSFLVYMANSKSFVIIFMRDSLISLKLNTNIISPYDTML